MLCLLACFAWPRASLPCPASLRSPWLDSLPCAEPLDSEDVAENFWESVNAGNTMRNEGKDGHCMDYQIGKGMAQQHARRVD